MKQIILDFLKPNYKKIILAFVFLILPALLLFCNEIYFLKNRMWIPAADSVIQNYPLSRIIEPLIGLPYIPNINTLQEKTLLTNVKDIAVFIFHIIALALFSLIVVYLLSCLITFWRKTWKKKLKVLFIALKILLLTILVLLTIWQNLVGDGPEGLLETTFAIIQLFGFFIIIPFAYLLSLGTVTSMLKKPLVSFFTGLGLSLAFVVIAYLLLWKIGIIDSAIGAFIILIFSGIIGLVGIIETVIIAIIKTKKL